MRTLSTDLALAPTGWWQRQRRIGEDELHPALAESELSVFPARFPRRLAFSPGLYRAAREAMRACDVVHIHNLWQYPQYAGYRAARRAGVPYVLSPHGSLDPYLREHGRGRKRLTTLLWQRDMLAGAALIHVTTNAEEQLIADVAPDVPRAVVPCGLYVEDFKRLPPRPAFRRRHLDGYDGPVIVFLGRLTYKKGLDALVRAFARVRTALECRLVIAGPDDEQLQPSLQRLAGELGVRREVCFTGPVYGDERLAVLSTADVWALSSYTENFGIAVAEAMAAGCAVVVSPQVNLASEIAQAGAGIVADVEADAFATAVLEVLTDQALRTRLQAAAPPFAARYDWTVVAPLLVEMYRAAARATT
jgi:glycosyltransferase involved in cell wall biosynthesis